VQFVEKHFFLIFFCDLFLIEKSIYIKQPQRKESKKMIINRLKLLSFLSLLMISACVPAHIDKSNQQGYVSPLQKNLSEQLDHLYQNDKSRWRQTMQHMILSEDDKLPVRHLAHSIYYFNRIQDQKVCLEATYLYLEQQSKNSHYFQEDDRVLFSKLVEYVLRTPDIFDISRIKMLCRDVQNSVCDELR
jgi:hypothetical protein